MKKILIPLLTCLLFACSTNNETTSTSSSSVHPFDDPIEELKTEYVNHLSCSGVFLDLAIDRWLCVGEEYKGTFSITDKVDQTVSIVNSNPEKIEITISNTTITFKPKMAGDTILQIIDSEGILQYRNVIKARRKIASEDISRFLVDRVDHFQAWGLNGQSAITFLSEEEAVFSGFDGTTNLGRIPFKYRFDGNSENSGDEYKFTILEFENNINDLQCVAFYLDFTGCLLHLMTKNITVDVYTPVL